MESTTDFEKLLFLWVSRTVPLILLLDGSFGMEDKYLYMIRQAQEFMNENRPADLPFALSATQDDAQGVS